MYNPTCYHYPFAAISIQILPDISLLDIHMAQFSQNKHEVASFAKEELIQGNFPNHLIHIVLVID